MMNIDKELVELAIDELKSLGQRASLSAVMKMTGYSYPDLIEAGYQHLARKYTKTPQATVYRPTEPEPQVQLEATVEAYTAHLRDNYFAHPETLDQVEQYLRVEVDGYQAEVFRLAVNKLMLSNEIIEQQLRPNHYTFAPIPKVEPLEVLEPQQNTKQPANQQEWNGKPTKTGKVSYLTYLVMDGSTVSYHGDDFEQATDTAVMLSLRTGQEVAIYKKHKAVSVTITYSTEYL